MESLTFKEIIRLPIGLYLITRPKKGTGRVTHYAILSIGIITPGRIEVFDTSLGRGVKRHTLEKFLGDLPPKVGHPVSAYDLPGARARLEEAIATWGWYRLFFNNCEHLTTYVLEGVHRSSQAEAFFDDCLETLAVLAQAMKEHLEQNPELREALAGRPVKPL